MRVQSITFSVEKTTPLEPITGNDDDHYANVKPCASMTVAFDGFEELELAEASDMARDYCLEQLVKFHHDIITLLRPSS